MNNTMFKVIPSVLLQKIFLANILQAIVHIMMKNSSYHLNSILGIRQDSKIKTVGYFNGLITNRHMLMLVFSSMHHWDEVLSHRSAGLGVDSCFTFLLPGHGWLAGWLVGLLAGGHSRVLLPGLRLAAVLFYICRVWMLQLRKLIGLSVWLRCPET